MTACQTTRAKTNGARSPAPVGGVITAECAESSAAGRKTTPKWLLWRIFLPSRARARPRQPRPTVVVVHLDRLPLPRRTGFRNRSKAVLILRRPRRGCLENRASESAAGHGCGERPVRPCLLKIPRLEHAPTTDRLARSGPRRGGRVVECTALEMRHRCKPIGGSNPSLSASCRRLYTMARYSARWPHGINARTATGYSQPKICQSSARLRTHLILPDDGGCGDATGGYASSAQCAVDATIISRSQRSAGSLRRLLCEICLKGMAGSGIGGGRTASRLSSREDCRLFRATVKIRSVPAIVFGATLQCGMISATRRAYPAAWIASSISVDASP